MSDKPGVGARWKAYRPSKTMYFWSCIASIAATMIVGFSWGGWQTAGSAAEHTQQAVEAGRAQLVADLCVSRFEHAADAAAQFAALKKTDSWSQSDFITNGGWVTLPGTTQPVEDAADICVRRLLAAKLPTTTTAKASATAG